MAFLVIFGVGLLLTVVTFILGDLFGGDGSGDAGSGVGESSPSPFSSRILFVFLTSFGGVGYIAMALGWPVWGAASAAIIGGLAVAGGTFFLIVVPMARQQGSVKVSQSDFLDAEAEVTAEIPEGGIGRVTIVAPQSGARISHAARSVTGDRIPFGSTVRVLHAGPGVVTVTEIRVGGRHGAGEAIAKEQS